MIAGGALGQRCVAALGSGDPALGKAAEQAALGNWEKALALLGPADDRQPAKVHALRGLALFAGNDIAAARTSLERAWSDDATSPLLGFFLGWVRRAAGESSRAIPAWRAAVALDPSLVSAYLALAETYVALAHPELAVQVLQEGLRHVPGSPELTMKLSDIQGR
jgi:tetratricopeptide (TPR) repeat protein